jgi:hypothetical protein
VQPDNNEDDANKKRQRRERGKREITEIVWSAKKMILEKNYIEANDRVHRKMMELTKNQNNVFDEDSIELLPAYFVLAVANIMMGGDKRKKAEDYLISAFWNLLKSGADDGDRATQEETLVTDKEKDLYRAELHKTFGRLNLANNNTADALKELSNGAYKECLEYGPESIQVTSSYYYMGRVFIQKEELENAKSFYLKIIEIWKSFILEVDLRDLENYDSKSQDELYYLEARDQVQDILLFFENELGP